jgi:hypothetical protein
MKINILLIITLFISNIYGCISPIENKNINKISSDSIRIDNIDSVLIGKKIIGSDFKIILREYNKPKKYIYNYGVDEDTDSIATIYLYNKDLIINDCKIILYAINVNYEDAEAQSLIGIIYDNKKNIIDSFIFYQRGYSPDIEEVISNTYIIKDKIVLKTFIKDFYKNQSLKKTYYYKLKNNRFIKDYQS